jgi:hypothetical protein
MVKVDLSPPLDLGLNVKTSFCGDEDERVEELLGREARVILGTRERGASLRADDSSLVLEGALWLDNKKHVEEAFRWLDCLVIAAAAIKKRRGSIRVASAVAAFEPGLVRFAKEHGLDVIRCPLLAFGNFEEVGMTISAARNGDGAHVMRARLWPEGDRFAGISIVPYDEADSAIEGNVITMRDEAFDRIFQVYATNVKMARAALDDSVRALLCKLNDQFPNVSVTDGALAIAGVSLDANQPNAMAEMGERLLTLAPSLSGGHTRGPYR